VTDTFNPDPTPEDFGTASTLRPEVSDAEQEELDARRITIDPDDDEDLPAQVARFLLPAERRVIITRTHWVRILPGTIIFAGGLIVAAVINAWLYARGTAPAAVIHPVWWAALAGCAYGTWLHLRWRGTWFVLTGRRAMFIQSFPYRHVEQLPLDKIKGGDVKMDQSATGSLLGYGTLDFASFATEEALDRIRYLPGIVGIFNAVNKMILPAETTVRGPRR